MRERWGRDLALDGLIGAWPRLLRWTARRCCFGRQAGAGGRERGRIKQKTGLGHERSRGGDEGTPAQG